MEKRFTKDPYLIFSLSMAVYLAVGLVFARFTQLVYHPDYICDLYFGFDNMLHASSAVRHPLISGLSYFFNHFYSAPDPGITSVILVVVCSILLSLQNLFIFKTLREVLGLDLFGAWLITVLFMSCGMNLLLSFTFDSYVVSGVLLSAFFYYFLKFEKAEKPMPKAKFFGLSLLICGVTVTNFLKVALVSLVSKYPGTYFKRILLLAFPSIILGLLFFVKARTSLLFINEYRAGFEDYGPRLFHYFFGSSFILPAVRVGEIPYINGEPFAAVTGAFHGVWQSVILTVFVVLLCIIIITNLKHFAVQFLLLSFAVDVMIHGILRLGLSEAYIFQGNYMFIWPLLIGIGYRKWSKARDLLYFKMILIVLMLAMLTANLEVLADLFVFGVRYYPGQRN